MKTRSFILICCIVMAISICTLFAGCTQQQTPTEPVVPEPTSPFQLDWHMKGSLINPNGDFAGSVPVTIQGTLTLDDQGLDKGDLTITAPKTYRYFFLQEKEGYTAVNRKYDNLAYPVFEGYFCLDTHDNSPSVCSFAIDPVKEYAIFQWRDGSRRFLVASQDPNVTAVEILDHFKDFVEKYGFDFT